MAERATAAVLVGERFYLAAILLYILLVLALMVRLAQMFAAPVPHVGLGRVAVAGWTAHGVW